VTATRHDWIHTSKATLPGDAERVFAALTTPEALTRWFAEHVQVEPHEGGAFRFWGRHSYGTVDAVNATQRVTCFEPPSALGFTWRFEDAPSEVTVTATPAEPDTDGARTALEVRHAFPARLTTPWSEELVDDLWRLTLGNLSAYLRGGDGIVLPDYTDPNPEIRLSIIINAPRERVFRALIEPEAMNAWVAAAADVDPRIGGHYGYGWTYKIGERDVVGGPTTILDLVPNQRLVTDWLDWRGDETRPPTRVAWLLDDVPGGTRVTLVHGGFARVVDQSDYPFGWVYFMGKLKATVETPS